MATGYFTAAEIRLRAIVINERTKLISSTLANGGLALVAGALGLIWADGSTPVHWMLVFVGIVTIFVGIGILDFLQAQD